MEVKELPVWGGTRLAYRELGAGPTLLMLHGSAANSRSWLRVAEGLERQFRMIIPDLPGYGESGPQPVHLAPHSRNNAELLAAFLGPSEGLTIVAHSSGGNVAFALALAARFPVRALVLMEPPLMAALRLTGEDATYQWAESHFRRKAVALARAGDPEGARCFLDGWCGDGAFDRLPQKARDYLAAQVRAVAYDIEGSFADDYTREEFARVAAPTMVLVGDQGTKLAGTIAGSLCRLMQRCEMKVVPGADHNMIATHPQAVAQTLVEFLAHA